MTAVAVDSLFHMDISRFDVSIRKNSFRRVAADTKSKGIIKCFFLKGIAGITAGVGRIVPLFVDINMTIAAFFCFWRLHARFYQLRIDNTPVDKEYHRKEKNKNNEMVYFHRTVLRTGSNPACVSSGK